MLCLCLGSGALATGAWRLKTCLPTKRRTIYSRSSSLLSRAEEKLRALRERLGEKACNLVQLNSREEGSGNSVYEGLFRAHMQFVVPGGGGGEPARHPSAPSQVTTLPSS
jgi:hypothetical protein